MTRRGPRRPTRKRFEALVAAFEERAAAFEQIADSVAGSGPVAQAIANTYRECARLLKELLEKGDTQ